MNFQEPSGLHGLQMLFMWTKEDVKIWWTCLSLL